MRKYFKYINPAITSLLFLMPLAGYNYILNINEVHSAIGAVVLAAAYITLIFERDIFISKRFLFYCGIFILFIFILFLSGLVNGRLALSFEYIFRYAFILLVIIYFYFFVQKRNYNFLFYVIAFSSVVFSAAGLIQLCGADIPVMNYTSRPGSFLMDRTFAAEYVTLTLPFLIFNCLKSGRLKLLNLFFLLVPAAYLFSLRTRSAYISVLIFITIIFFTQKEKFKLLPPVLILIAAISFSFINFPNFEKDRLNPLTSLDKYSMVRYEPNVSRLFFIDASINLFIDKPLTGIGTGGWSGFFGKYHGDEISDRHINENSAINPHNEYLNFLSENGIFGFLLFAALIFIPLRYIKKDTPFFPALSAFAFICFVSFPLENISLMMITAFSIAAAFPAASEVKRKYLILSPLIFISICCAAYFLLRTGSEKKYITAMQYKSNGKYEEMTKQLENINTYLYPVDPNKMPVAFYKGAGYFQMKNFEKAYKDFSEAADLMPYIPQILNNKAVALIALGNDEEAAKLLIEIKKYFPYYTEPQINLLSLYMKNKKYSEAETLISELNFKNDRHTRYAGNYNNFLLLKKEFSESKY
jgi:Lipid A core - O-antigen ligase and related enzymes